MFLIIPLLSCSSKTEKAFAISKRLTIKDSLIIHLPDTIQHLGGLTRPTYNSTNRYFSYYTVTDQNIKVYSYARESQNWNLVRLSLNGKNQVYGQGAFNIKGNTITYIPFNAPKIIKLNNEGIKTSEYSFFSNRNMAFDSKIKNPVFHHDDENMYFDLGSYVSLSNPKTFEKTYTVGVYSFSKDTFTPIIKYPEEYHDKTWSGNDAEHHFVMRDELIFMNFAKSKYVYVYNNSGELVHRGLVNSENIKESKGNNTSDSMQNAIRQINNGYYSKIIYDKWRDVFYRLGVYFDVNYEINSAQDVANAFRKKKIFIITFDKDLNVLAQDEFDAMKTRLNEYYHWVNEEGLFLYQIPSSKPETTYQFAKFELQDISL